MNATVQFSGAAFEHVGWASDEFCCAYLIFSTANTTTNLFARSYTPSGEIRTDLGPIPTGYHAYRIERQAALSVLAVSIGMCRSWGRAQCSCCFMGLVHPHIHGEI